MTKRDCIATTLITIGIVLIAVGGSKSEACYTLDEIVHLYGRPPFIGELQQFVSTYVGESAGWFTCEINIVGFARSV
jgi:hypothetical protein